MPLKAHGGLPIDLLAIGGTAENQMEEEMVPKVLYPFGQIA
jgi:hypothetical protein